MLALALVGCGGMGCRHIRGLHKLREIGSQPWDLIAVCDLKPENAEQAANLANDILGRRPEVFVSTGNMHERLPQLEAVIVTTSPDLHAPVGIAALEHGLHVMVETPIALTVGAWLVTVWQARTIDLPMGVVARGPPRTVAMPPHAMPSSATSRWSSSPTPPARSTIQTSDMGPCRPTRSSKRC